MAMKVIGHDATKHAEPWRDPAEFFEHELARATMYQTKAARDLADADFEAGRRAARARLPLAQKSAQFSPSAIITAEALVGQYRTLKAQPWNTHAASLVRQWEYELSQDSSMKGFSAAAFDALLANLKARANR